MFQIISSNYAQICKAATYHHFCGLGRNRFSPTDVENFWSFSFEPKIDKSSDFEDYQISPEL